MDHILEAQRKTLSNWNSAFHEALRGSNDLASMKKDILDHLGGLRYVKTANSLPMQPFALPEELYAEMAKAGLEIAKLVRSIPSRIFPSEHDLYLKKVGYSQEYVDHNCLIDLLNLDSYDPFFMRPDFLVAAGRPYLVECNISCAIGGLTEMHLANELYSRWPLHQSIERQFNSYTISPLEKLASSIRRVFLGQKTEPLVAICEWGEENPRYFVEMAEFLSNYGIRAIFCTPSELKQTDQGLIYQGEHVDFLYWGFAYLEAVDRFEELQSILEATKLGKVTLLCDFIDELLSSKANLVFLSDERYRTYFSKEEWELCNRYVPWTRFLEDVETHYQGQKISLLEYVKRNKKDFIVKPTTFYGGKGIVVGHEVSQCEWEAFLDSIAGSWTHIVQECLSTDTHELAMYNDEILEIQEFRAVYGPFLLGGQAGGCLVRATPVQSGIVINATNGAQVFHSEILKI